MKLKKGLVLRKLGNKYVIVATGSLNRTFNAMIKLNEMGADIFNELKNETTRDDIISNLLKMYDANEDEIKNDVDTFIGIFRENGLLDE